MTEEQVKADPHYAWVLIEHLQAELKSVRYKLEYHQKLITQIIVDRDKELGDE
jgi:hypothetical protein